jgi:hypothetical protein
MHCRCGERGRTSLIDLWLAQARSYVRCLVVRVSRTGVSVTTVLNALVDR